MVPLDLSYKLPKSTSERFGFTVEDEMLSPAKEQRIMNVGRRHRNKASGLTMPDEPIFATRPPPMPRCIFQTPAKALDLRGVSRSLRKRKRRWIESTLLLPAPGT
jgi:hypothetical protein